MNVGLAAAVVAAFDGIVEQAPDGIPVIWIVLSCINSTLRKQLSAPDGGSPECKSSRRGNRASAKVAAAEPPARPVPTTSTVCVPFVGRVDQFDTVFIRVPFVLQWTCGNLRIENG